MIAADQFKRGMRRLAGSVCVITTLDDNIRHGLVATAVTSVSTDPPSLLICVNRSASAHDPIVRSERFCVNVLRHADEATARRFSSPQDRDLRFSVGGWSVLETGAPALTEALAAFDCRVAQVVPYGSHTICIGEVVGVRLAEAAVDPLLYVDGSYCRLESALSVGLPQ